MGYFALSNGDSWEEHLDTLKTNIKLLKETNKNTDYSYLFDFMENNLKNAKQKYLEERHGIK